MLNRREIVKVQKGIEMAIRKNSLVSDLIWLELDLSAALEAKNFEGVAKVSELITTKANELVEIEGRASVSASKVSDLVVLAFGFAEKDLKNNQFNMNEDLTEFLFNRHIESITDIHEAKVAKSMMEEVEAKIEKHAEFYNRKELQDSIIEEMANAVISNVENGTEIDLFEVEARYKASSGDVALPDYSFESEFNSKGNWSFTGHYPLRLMKFENAKIKRTKKGVYLYTGKNERYVLKTY